MLSNEEYANGNYMKCPKCEGESNIEYIDIDELECEICCFRWRVLMKVIGFEELD